MWECAVDLAIHLCSLWDVTAQPTANGLKRLTSSHGEGVQSIKVLDLGCGHGLPGILAACLGMEADFQVLVLVFMQVLHMINPLLFSTTTSSGNSYFLQMQTAQDDGTLLPFIFHHLESCLDTDHNMPEVILMNN